MARALGELIHTAAFTIQKHHLTPNLLLVRDRTNQHVIANVTVESGMATVVVAKKDSMVHVGLAESYSSKKVPLSDPRMSRKVILAINSYYSQAD